MTKKKTCATEKSDATWYLEFLDYWQKKYATHCRYITDWQEWVYYNPEGYYQSIAEDRINEIVYKYMDQSKVVRSMARLRLALSSIQADQHFCANLKDFDADHQIRNVKTGLLHLDTKQITPHTPAYLSLRQADVEFVPNQINDPTPCWDDLWNKFPKAMSYVEWHNRAIIYNNMNERLALFLVGPRGAGKGSVLNVMDAWYHKEVSHVKLNNIGDSFGLSPLVGKMGNLDKEGIITRLNSMVIGNFKSITGRDGELSVNIKGKTPVDVLFIPFFFSTVYNQLPQLPGTDIDAFLDRCLIAEFNIRSIQDPKFKDQLMQERHIIFTQLVRIGYTPFFAKQYKVWKDTDSKIILHHDFWIQTNRDLWDKWSNPIRAAVENLFERDQGLQRMNLDNVMEIIITYLDGESQPVPKDHTLKALATSALRKLGIGKTHTGSLTYYAPIHLKNPTSNKAYLDENPEDATTTDYNPATATPSSSLDTFFQ